MIVYVGFAQPDEFPAWASTYARHAQRFEEASGEPVLVVPYWMVSSALIGRIDASSVVLSGFARSFDAYSAAAFDGIVDMLDCLPELPVLAICGSHQLVGFWANGALRSGAALSDQPMRRRAPGEPVLNPDYHPDYIMERGFYELAIAAPDPLFENCGSPPIVCESHYCEIKVLPERFRVLASTPECRIQAMRHVSRPLVGVQFHPEDYTEQFPDGRAILRSFFGSQGIVPGRRTTD